ncbi:response regulator [Demequina gelatinilytica]|uniref:response regulator n=1 Tax=Demequina gelatinilytica TaxID=1638980 RepID=UPI0007827382|nr:response regulator transcription factor [Demequina gelatinilytica]
MTDQAAPRTDAEPTTVLVVDDDPMVRQQVRLVLASSAGIHVLGEAADGAAALREVERLSPHVVLMDVSMPTMSGVEATAALASRRSATAVIALTALDHDAVLLQMLEAGARGFVPKEYADEDLETAISRVARGEGFVSPHCQPALFRHLTERQATDHRARAQERLARLTDRERAVARLVATGAQNAAIAAEIFVSPSTVKSHLDAIRTKLGVASREEIAVIVERAGAGLPG